MKCWTVTELGTYRVFYPHCRIWTHRVLLYNLHHIVCLPGVRGGHGIADVDDSLHAPSPILAEVTDIVDIGPGLRNHPDNNR